MIRRSFKRPLAVASLAALLCGGAAVLAGAAERSVKLPAPAADLPAQAGTRSVVLAGGCFWGVQGVFAHVKGVQQVISGYSGGSAATADYQTVSTGETGHAESVKIVFDPRQLSFGRLLQIFF